MSALTNTERDLLRFALRVLDILAEEEDWDADMTAYIAEQACELNLADSNAEGMFVTVYDPDQVAAGVQS